MPIDFAKELNEEQLPVVTDGEGPCLVLAGAGSGKTRTITFRVAYLLEHGIPADSILLLTFTNKAANQMLDRVKQLMGSAPQNLWSGTFHNIGFRLVNKYAKELGFSAHITILDSEDSRSLFSQILKDEGVDTKSKKIPSVNVMMETYSYSRNAMINLEEAVDIKAPRFFGAATDMVHWFAMYEKRKRESNFADFDDLLVLWLKLLTEFPEIRVKLSSQFRYVLVDEYQDTNRVQARIVQHMCSVNGNILAVGDDAQSIYSFRAADIANILDFAKQYPGARIFHLLTNYRSSPQILELANEVIKQNKNQFQKELRSALGNHTKPTIIRSDTTAHEAEHIVDIIQKYRKEGRPLSEIAILFRSSFHSQLLEFELTERGVPYEYRGGQRFFERAHIKDVLAYLRAFASPKDSIAWHRMLVQQEGIGLESARKIYDQVKLRAQTSELFMGSPVEIEKRAARGWDVVVRTFENIAHSHGTVGDKIRVIKSAYDFYAHKEFTNGDDRIADIDQLANFTDRSTDLKTFLAETALQEQFKGKNTDVAEKVILSTIHQSKGLEWDTVFIVSLVANAFPSERASLEEGGMEEERRLFYVAVTRARRNLFLTYASLGGKNNEYLMSPSPFLEELSEALFDSEHKSSQVAEVTYEPDEQSVNWRGKSFLRSIDEL